jgi:glyoxylase-like metal-dependent hydrolase (beta-lactamase superfamily II)
MPPENTNSILVSNGADCVIFDAWGRVCDWENLLANRGLKLTAIYSTHGHSDHISAAPGLAQMLNIPWYLNHRDLNVDGVDFVLWGNGLLKYLQVPEIPDDYKRPLDLAAGRREVLPGAMAEITNSPGHSAGGMAFYFPDQRVLIIGDTLFQDCVGRYDLPGANKDELFKSIARIYDMNLPDDTKVFHGHGMETTIGWLKENNRYFHS